MTANGILQILLFFLLVLLVTRPLGAYMARVFNGERTPLDRVLGPLERLIYRLCGIDPARVGKPIGAFIRVTTPSQPRYERLLEFAQERGEIVECHALTGEDNVIMRVQVGGMAELERLTTSLAHFGQTTTSMILGSPIPWRNVLDR